MTGLARFRCFRLFLLLALVAPLFALRLDAIWAQELDVEITEPVDEAAESLEEQTGIDLGELTKKELRRLCRDRPELRTTKECREVLRKVSSKGGASGPGTTSASVSSPAKAPSASSRPSSRSSGAPRAQTRASRPRIDVQKRNDANGDGVYSSGEVATRSGADVPFRVTIRNVGETAVTIRKITDSYQSETVDVCEELVGDRIRPGKSAVCNFTIDDYAPPPNDSRANTVRVTVKESRGNRTTSDSDISTVTTMGGGGDQVLGASESNPDAEKGDSKEFAETGFYLTRLMALALALLVVGTTLLRVGRRRPATQISR